MARPRKSEKKEGKRERVPVGGHRLKLQVPEIDGYVQRWVSDVDGRLQVFEDAGYEYVERKDVGRIGEGEIHQDNTDLNSRVSKIVSKGGGQPIRAYLMKIRKAWYDADQKAKEAVNERVDQALRQGNPGGKQDENRYIPKSGISISR